MKKMHAKLATLVFGFLFFMHLLHALQGGSKDEDGLVASGNKVFLMGRKLKTRKADKESPKLVDLKREDSFQPQTSEVSAPTNLEREIDHLMKHDYSAHMKPRKRSPIHNGVPNGH